MGTITADAFELATSLERLVALVRRLAPQPDISISTASTLRSLEISGACRLSDLAAREGVTQPAMTQLVSRLERDGYAERRGAGDDARVVMVHLTPTGADLLRHRRAARAERLHDLIGQLPAPDRAAIHAALPALTLLADLGRREDRSPQP
jgi:DNA-binding MarR family transcriptional regulator